MDQDDDDDDEDNNSIMKGSSFGSHVSVMDMLRNNMNQIRNTNTNNDDDDSDEED